MASDTKKQVTVSGIAPVASGEDWFVIDESGTFSVDKNMTATIWLVGGGCDGGSGVWNGNDVDVELEPIPDTGTGDSFSGSGGDGGYVTEFTDIKISANTELTAVIAEANDMGGTSLNIDGRKYECKTPSQYIYHPGGDGGSLPLPDAGEKWADQNMAVLPHSGENGVETPYGFVGSSGGGGAVCNGITTSNNGLSGGEGAGNGKDHRAAGSDAQNYGCGGGGGAICGRIAEGQPGGKGKQGGIIISYEISEESKTLVVERRYIKKTTVAKKCDVNYAVSQNSSHCCGNSGHSGCGCGHSTDNESYQNGVMVENFSDGVNIKDNINISEFMAKIETLQAENSALLQQIQELENELNVN